MNMDTFNYGSAAQIGVGSDYQDNQYNALGESLSPTKPANGAPITVDYSNDQRNPQDYKQQLRQANLDTLGAQDTTNKIVMKDGYLIDKTPDSRMDMSRQAAQAFGDAYLAHMGDQGAATAAGALAASQAVSYHADRLKREKMLPDLEKSGRYQSIDLEKWRDTGDTKDLITNAGKWLSDGHGFEHNSLTGETRQIQGYQEPEKLTQVKLGDRVAFVNREGKEVNSLAVAPKASATGGGIGLDDDEASSNGGYVFENGQWVQHTTYANGTPKIVVANAKMQSQLNAQHAADKPSASETMVNNDLDTLDQAVDTGRADKFTGQIVGRSETAGDWMSSNADQPTRDAYQAANRVQGYMQNQGVGAARSMGLSGINTLEEAKRAFASMPQLDKTSPEALKHSVAKIRAYVTDYNNQNRAQQGVSESAPKSGSKFSNLW